ncbi:MAG: fibronectin type III domain-containing protein [candidate division KSB1 bacterium]|nr:fibronectin type III domain-containing protein [candidate division KSB1 bacterium]MDZ7300959.1 fibronectin type III domain-containing protein [candidate division KSB1 bacterium]MDZ7310363.1 fibronectin type III domain-containing protein [candidate division KSB1 bacterium]
MKILSHGKRFFLLLSWVCVIVLTAGSTVTYAQYAIKWMSAGSLHSWYSAIGCEIEEGRIKRQQDGLRWPAIYKYQDMEAAKALWIGAKDFTDEKGAYFPHKVVHVGPRVTGTREFFPIKFEMTSRFDPPEVFVDGAPSMGEATVENDRVDPSMKWDRIIENVTNCQLGITMTRKIFQFSQQYHDNYIVYDYVFTNTGNVDDDPEIELPNQTLEGVYFYFQYRYAICANTRYVIGNATGWGINTMLDTRGDGVKPDPPGENLRVQFAWHGKYPVFTAYDNIGGPIWAWDGTIYTTKADTTGRLGATQFVGIVTLHADKSATDKSDDWGQPSTTSYRGSDEPLTSNNDAYNIPKMTLEYEWMSSGHMSPRHADKVEPAGKFDEPTGDPALGTPGGFSNCNGYGPYTLKPGESIHLVMAEGAAGISRELQESVGAQYKKGLITAKAKNQIVLTGKDSLFQTFRRAQANYQSGYNIPQPPLPPRTFMVNGGGDRISLSWTLYDGGEKNLTGFEIYRATGQVDSTYRLVYKAGPAERSYNDRNLSRGVAYYYYIVSVGDPANNDGTGLTPRGPLKSSRYYTQAYDPSNLKRPEGTSMDQIRVVPNPFSLGADPNRLRYPGEPDKIAFLNIPGECTIQIFTEAGELIQTLEHTDGSGDAYWNCLTSSNQVVVSGIYIAVVTDTRNGQRKIVKFVIVR